jgi:hypothetical protein
MIVGAFMAVWAMAAMWVTGSGFWTQVNLIAHTFYRSARLTAPSAPPAASPGSLSQPNSRR